VRPPSLLSRGRLPTVALALSACVTLSACTGGRDAADSRTLTVLAAASLTEGFGELEAVFEDANPGVDVRISFDSSATLAQQALEGAPADVLATADVRTMQTAVDGGAVAGDPELFATNVIVLVTPADDPADVSGIDDLAGATYVVCVPSAPCGALAATLLDDNGVTAEPASLEVDVKAVLTKVTLGEADAGLVYATDAASAGDAVRTLEVPGADEAPTDYPVAVLDQAAEADLAQAWIDLLTSSEGQEILAGYGFGPAR